MKKLSDFNLELFHKYKASWKNSKKKKKILRNVTNERDKPTDNGSATPAGLVAASLSHAFALFVAVSVGANIFGGHVNPAVTFGAFIGGQITLIRGLLYWIAQFLGSVVACTGGMWIQRRVTLGQLLQLQLVSLK